MNPGFENALRDQPQSWLGIGTVDYYQNRSLVKGANRKSDDEPQVPAPVEGRNYIGLRAFPDATETAIGRFTAPLVKDQWYKISCMVMRPVADCNQPVSGIAVVISDSIPTSKLWYGLSAKVPFIMLTTNYFRKNAVLIDSFVWTRVFGYYRAKGGERFLWAGNFFGANPDQIDQMQLNEKTVAKKGEILHCLYHYYYDDFSVIPYVNPEISLLTIRDITFDSGSAAITHIGDDQINMLLSLLKDMGDYSIEITGHTDSDGKAEDNLKLSNLRAQSVKNWMISNGIPGARIQAKGMGEQLPVAPNDTPQNKALNRRVEIKINR